MSRVVNLGNGVDGKTETISCFFHASVRMMNFWFVWWNSNVFPAVRKYSCTVDTCQNGGTCMEDGVNVICRCLDDYRGKFCEGKSFICSCKLT